MQELPKAMNIPVNNAGGILPLDEIRKYRKEYRIILRQGEKDFPSQAEIKKTDNISKSMTSGIILPPILAPTLVERHDARLTQTPVDVFRKYCS